MLILDGEGDADAEHKIKKLTYMEINNCCSAPLPALLSEYILAGRQVP